MNEETCIRCRERPATSLGAPVAERLDRRPDGTPIGPNESLVRYDPATWMRLCEQCVDVALAAGELALVFDLATWRDPRAN
jgi:hypothetical protein